MISVEAWEPADGLKLEPNAMNAARESARSLALTAGPGAGKTEMLAQRADFLLRTGTCRYPKRILAISFKKDASQNLKARVRRRCGTDLATRFDSYTFHAFAKLIIDRFRPVLTGRDALDAGYAIHPTQRIDRTMITFNDLVPLAINILRSSVFARNAIRQTYSDVFLDEFQDCTNDQYQLIREAFAGTPIRLTAVGDTKQKIMGWAGAMDGIFATFAQDFHAIKLNMYRNFRSKPRLLRMQNEIIRFMDPASIMPEEQIAGDEGEIQICSFADQNEEAESIADQIQSWIQDEEVSPSEIAVLVARQPDLYAAPLMATLEARGIPFRNEQQMQDLAVEPAAKLIVDFLACLYGTKKPKAWFRLSEQMDPFLAEEEMAERQHQFQSFMRTKRRERTHEAVPFSNRQAFVTELLEEMGRDQLAGLSHEYESGNRLDDVIRDTRSRIDELVAKEPDLPTALDGFSDDQAVRILTMHKSKGLEFHSVILLGVDNENFWGREPDEDRCLFFVGISRAKDRLLLTYAERRERPARHNQWRETRTPHDEFLGYAAPFVEDDA